MGQSNKELIALPFQGRAKSPPAAEIGRGFFGGGLHDALQAEVIVDPNHEQAEIFPHTTYESFASDLLNMLNRNITCVEMDPSYVSMEDALHSIEQSTHQSDREDNRYIYHSDLPIVIGMGSSSFLTDTSGTPTQHLQYLPFGEPFIEQRSVTEYYTPYTFSAKERDLETGYSYFGARYYSSTLSIWLSVDPMSDERSWLSPYNYCQWNPVILVDPNGLIDGWYEDMNGNVIFDQDINNQNDLKERGINGKYLGQSTNLYCYSSDSHVLGGEDGNIYPMELNPFVVKSDVNNTNHSDKAASIMFYTSASTNFVGLTSSTTEQYYLHSYKNTKNISLLKKTGRVCFYTGAACSAYEGTVAIFNKDYSKAGKSAMDIGMGAFATFGSIPGLIVGGGYFFLDGCGVFDFPSISSQPPHPTHIVQDKTYVQPKVIIPMKW